MPVAVKYGGTWRAVVPYARVGGSWRRIEKMWVCVGGTWRQFFVRQITTNFTLTTGNYFDGPYIYTGYLQGIAGSLSSSNDGNGKTITNIYDSTLGFSVVSIAGFGADPGAGYLVSIVNNTDSRSLNGAAASYSYISGTAWWQWSGMQLLFPTTGSKSMTIVIQP